MEDITENQGATVVISHHPRPGMEKQFEAWLDEISPVSKSSPGIIDWQIIRPIAGLTFVYTIILRFDKLENLKGWMESADRKYLIEKVRPLLEKEDVYKISSGLDFLFTQDDEQHTKNPVRWKQFLITWSAIFPLSIIVPLIVIPLLRWLYPLPVHIIDSLAITGCVVALMIYVVMPNYARLVRKWLFK